MSSNRGRPEASNEILHLTAMRSTKYGSLERYFVALAAGCTERGWRFVLQYNEPPGSARYVGDLREARAAVVIRQLGEGPISAAGRAMMLIIRRRPKVVHLHFCGSLTVLAVGLLARRLGVTRTVATMHSMPKPRSPALMRAGYERIDSILCVSRSVQQALVALGVPPAALTTRYLGVPDLGPLPAAMRDEVRERLAIPAGAPVLVTIVFTSPVKGTDVLIDAFLDHLAPRFPDLHLIVVGVPPAERGRVSPRADLSPSRVHWAGIQDDVRPFLAAADIYVQPSRAEGLGLAILEAMRESLPVVATNIGGIPEAVAEGESGFLVDPEAPAQLASAVSKLLTHPELARRFARAGHEAWKRRFRVTRSVELTLDEYGAAS